MYKRLLIAKNCVYVWPSNTVDEIFLCQLFSRLFKRKIRIIPIEPHEGGSTQEYYNTLWDVAQPAITGRVRLMNY